MEQKNKADPATAMDLSGIQDSFCFRALKEARRLAEALINEKGHFVSTPLQHPDPVGYSDDAFLQHQKAVVAELQTLGHNIRRFSLPLYHPFAHDVIRWTLDLPPTTPIKDFHVKRAALTACLTPLRQTVGSCFATAPAIEIQRFHLPLFLNDLYELLTRGRIKRVVNGTEYTAPSCLSTGASDLNKPIDPSRPYFASPGLIRALEIAGRIPETLPFDQKIALSENICTSIFRSGMRVKNLIPEETHPYFKATTDCALLKIWEFTLASYCDIKMEFSKWNLAWCVGLSPQEAGGIGSCLLRALEEKLQENRKELELRYQEAVHAQHALHAAESMRQTTEEGLRRQKSEIVVKLHHARLSEELYQASVQREKIIANILKTLIDHYTHHCVLHFQEIYDPEFNADSFSFYEDRPAGFRLIYKHSRSESLLWTPVHTPDVFIHVLDDFFKATEAPIADLFHEPYAKQLVSEMTTVILHHLHTPEFLESALARAKKHGRLPWAYSSGGSVEQIATLYFGKTSPLKAEKRPIQDPLDLFTFIIETMKGLPPSVTHKHSTLLLQSPTHVCLLLPHEPLFSAAWNDPGLTYTWIRDRWLQPTLQFYDSLSLSKETQQRLFTYLNIHGPLKASMPLDEFTSHAKQIPPDTLGALLFQEARPPIFLFADTNWPQGYFSFVIHPVTRSLEVWKTDLAGIRGAPLPLIHSWFKSDPWTIFWN